MQNLGNGLGNISCSHGDVGNSDGFSFQVWLNLLNGSEFIFYQEEVSLKNISLSKKGGRETGKKKKENVPPRKSLKSSPTGIRRKQVKVNPEVKEKRESSKNFKQFSEEKFETKGRG
ncbi:hypothetical protein CDAR_430441 [Caerostris darwini]|uniref:Uncharacterized protein n=1 Tax=Caerostris darwini TaxID=1538125 RepID=A0AAV4SSI5_9ARAC|nr:hypothetical protein CDAR_430441 [Caerostris darwini]